MSQFCGSGRMADQQALGAFDDRTGAYSGSQGSRQEWFDDLHASLGFISDLHQLSQRWMATNGLLECEGGSGYAHGVLEILTPSRT